MKLQDQVCSLELAKKLKELGVKQESLYRWIGIMLDENSIPTLWVIKWADTYWKGSNYSFSAYTVAELGEMLPSTVASSKYQEEDSQDSFICKLNVEGDWSKYIHVLQDTTEADARAKMLIYLMEHNL